MTVSYAFLTLLEKSERHGYDLKRAYDQRFDGGRELSFGAVYRVLAQLVRTGLVGVAGIEPGAGPERKRYAITDAGTADLRRWLDEPEEPAQWVQPSLFMKVVLALMSGRPAKGFLHAQRQRHLARMREVTARRRDAPPAAALRLDYELFHLEADLRWIEHARTRLADVAADVR